MLDINILPEGLNWFSFYSLIIASGFTSFITAALGIGGGMLLLSIMAQVLPIKAIIPTHGLVQLGSNAGRAVLMRDHIQWTYLLWFALGSAVGVFAGGQLVIALPINSLQLILGVFILISLWLPSIQNSFVGKNTLFISGLTSTFLTMFVGATGPFIVSTLRNFKLTSEGLVANSAAFMVLQHALKVIAFSALGFAFYDYAFLILLMIASGFLGTIIGRRLLLKFNEANFQKALKLLLSLLALRLILMAIWPT